MDKRQRFYSVKEFARERAVTSLLVYSWIKKGLLVVHRFGTQSGRGRIRISREDAERFDAAARCGKPATPEHEAAEGPQWPVYMANSDEEGRSMMRLLGEGHGFSYVVDDREEEVGP